jgi:hypothetical protein
MVSSLLVWAAIDRLAAQDLRSAHAQVSFLLGEALARRGVRVRAPGRASDA